MIDQPQRTVHKVVRKAACWTAADIRAEIVRLGSTPSRVAVEAGFSANAGRAALTSARYVGAEIALAAFLGICPSALWPERYALHAAAFRSPARQRAVSAYRAGRAA